MVVEIFDQPETTTFFAELLLPVPIPRLFTYRVPQAANDSVMVGQRAIVQFGDRKVLTGIITQLHHQAPTTYEAKYILELLDTYPVVTQQQLQFLSWVASYYLCTPGEVLNAALPSGLKLSSESRVQLHPAFSLEDSNHSFSEKELMLLKHLAHDSMTYTEITKLLGLRNLYHILKTLVGKEAIILFEEVKEKYRPKTEKKVRLAAASLASEALEKIFETLSKKPQQESLLLRYLQLVPVLSDNTINAQGIAKKLLMEDQSSESTLKTLVKKGVLEEFETIVSRFEQEGSSAMVPPVLSAEQHQALNSILKSFTTHAITLLHGITGSGKTEIYVNLIQQALEGGSQVLYLLPEIALTTQIVQRLKKIFGPLLGVYHSKFSDAERVEVWNGILSGRFKFVIGVRSSIFLPFDNLGLIIIDEEHDPSYKQQEPAPRYQARDSAIMLAQLHHAKVILGSATPSLETYYQAQQGKYGFVSLLKRFGEAQLPTITLADLGRDRKQKKNKGDFSSDLIQNIEKALEQKEQVIIFQNRRGYSPMVNCEDCGWVPKCINCAVSLTYHQFRSALICHYCGYRQTLPTACPTCSSTRIKTVGTGTEKLEEELKLHFPQAHVQRMDLDTTRSKTGYETILDEFEQGKTDILVGTQMVTKGLDFDRVSLVGIFNADRMIHFPDFRSYERAFQLITQVSGRAGRREKPGTVVIQTSSPDHPLLQQVLKHTLDEFYQDQLNDRASHGYPPFARLIEITVKHTDRKTCHDAADVLANQLRTKLPALRIMGPGEPIISKIRNQYLMSMLIKIPRDKHDLATIKRSIQETSTDLLKDKQYRSVKLIADVDPV